MLGDLHFDSTTIFSASYWRSPHDPDWTENGVGLASEWGCGDDGHLCGPGWANHADSSNGVLGYAEAKAGEPFLKIGVGLLIKGSCPACGSPGADDTYKFNSPYRVYGRPSTWEVRQESGSVLTMVHSAKLDQFGYTIHRKVNLTGYGAEGQIELSTTLHNTGSTRIRTPYYSHNLLSLDQMAAGPGDQIALDLNMSEYYDCLPWAEPLEDYFASDQGTDARAFPQSDQGTDARAFPQALGAIKRVAAPTRIKAVFGGSAATSKGAWMAAFDRQGVSISSTLSGPTPLFAYNLYIEERTLSPEPIQMVALDPGEHMTLTQTVRVRRTIKSTREGSDAAAQRWEVEAPSFFQWLAASEHRGFVRTGRLRSSVPVT